MMASDESWQLRCAELKQRGAYLYQSKIWSDCTFQLDEVTIKAHKLIMAMASPVFSKMLYGSFVKFPIPIYDVRPEVFNVLLEYIYSDNLNITSSKDACDLYYAAKKWRLPYVMKCCVTYLNEHMSPNNVCHIYKVACESGDKTLQMTCEKIFSSRTKEVLKDQSFYDLDIPTAKKLFSLDPLNINDELDLFKAVVDYAIFHHQNTKTRNVLRRITDCSDTYDDGQPASKKARCDLGDDEEMDEDGNVEESPSNASSPDSNQVSANKVTSPTIVAAELEDKEKYRELVYPIRFLTLSAQEFAECSTLSSLLTGTEMFALGMNISSRETTYTMPEGFSTSMVPRTQATREDRTRLTAVFRSIVHNIKHIQKYESIPFYLRNLAWTFMVIAAHSSKEDYFVLGVTCFFEQGVPEWMKHTKVKVKFTSTQKPVPKHLHRITLKINESNSEYGAWVSKVKREDLLNPEYGFVDDFNTVTYRVYINTVPRPESPDADEVADLISDQNQDPQSLVLRIPKPQIQLPMSKSDRNTSASHSQLNSGTNPVPPQPKSSPNETQVLRQGSNTTQSQQSPCQSKPCTGPCLTNPCTDSATSLSKAGSNLVKSSKTVTTETSHSSPTVTDSIQSRPSPTVTAVTQSRSSPTVTTVMQSRPSPTVTAATQSRPSLIVTAASPPSPTVTAITQSLPSATVTASTQSHPSPTVTAVTQSHPSLTVTSVTQFRPSSTVTAVTQSHPSPTVTSVTQFRPSSTVTAVTQSRRSPTVTASTQSHPSPTVTALTQSRPFSTVTAVTQSLPSPTVTASTQSHPSPTVTALTQSRPFSTVTAVTQSLPSPTVTASTRSHPSPTVTALTQSRPFSTVTAVTQSLPSPTVTASTQSHPSPTVTALTQSRPFSTVTAVTQSLPSPTVTASTRSHPSPTMTAVTQSRPSPIVTAITQCRRSPTVTASTQSHPSPTVTALTQSRPFSTVTAVTQSLPSPTVTASTRSHPSPTMTAVTQSRPSPIVTAITQCRRSPTVTASTQSHPSPTETAVTQSRPSPTVTAVTQSRPSPIVTAITQCRRSPTVTASTQSHPSPTETAVTQSRPSPTVTAVTQSRPSPIVTAITQCRRSPTVTASTQSHPSPTVTAVTQSRPSPTVTALTQARPSPTAIALTQARPSPTAMAPTQARPSSTAITLTQTRPSPTAALTQTRPSPTAIALTQARPSPTAMALTQSRPSPTLTAYPSRLSAPSARVQLPSSRTVAHRLYPRFTVSTQHQFSPTLAQSRPTSTVPNASQSLNISSRNSSISGVSPNVVRRVVRYRTAPYTVPSLTDGLSSYIPRIPEIEISPPLASNLSQLQLTPHDIARLRLRNLELRRCMSQFRLSNTKMQLLLNEAFSRVTTDHSSISPYETSRPLFRSHCVVNETNPSLPAPIGNPRTSTISQPNPAKSEAPLKLLDKTFDSKEHIAQSNIEKVPGQVLPSITTTPSGSCLAETDDSDSDSDDEIVPPSATGPKLSRPSLVSTLTAQPISDDLSLGSNAPALSLASSTKKTISISESSTTRTGPPTPSGLCLAETDDSDSDDESNPPSATGPKLSRPSLVGTLTAQPISDDHSLGLNAPALPLASSTTMTISISESSTTRTGPPTPSGLCLAETDDSDSDSDSDDESDPPSATGPKLSRPSLAGTLTAQPISDDQSLGSNAPALPLASSTKKTISISESSTTRTGPPTPSGSCLAESDDSDSDDESVPPSATGSKLSLPSLVFTLTAQPIPDDQSLGSNTPALPIASSTSTTKAILISESSTKRTGPPTPSGLCLAETDDSDSDSDDESDPPSATAATGPKLSRPSLAGTLTAQPISDDQSLGSNAPALPLASSTKKTISISESSTTRTGPPTPSGSCLAESDDSDSDDESDPPSATGPKLSRPSLAGTLTAQPIPDDQSLGSNTPALPIASSTSTTKAILISESSTKRTGPPTPSGLCLAETDDSDSDSDDESDPPSATGPKLSRPSPVCTLTAQPIPDDQSLGSNAPALPLASSTTKTISISESFTTRTDPPTPSGLCLAETDDSDSDSDDESDPQSATGPKLSRPSPVCTLTAQPIPDDQSLGSNAPALPLASSTTKTISISEPSTTSTGLLTSETRLVSCISVTVDPPPIVPTNEDMPDLSYDTITITIPPLFKIAKPTSSPLHASTIPWPTRRTCRVSDAVSEFDEISSEDKNVDSETVDTPITRGFQPKSLQAIAFAEIEKTHDYFENIKTANSPTRVFQPKSLQAIVFEELEKTLNYFVKSTESNIEHDIKDEIEFTQDGGLGVSAFVQPKSLKHLALKLMCEANLGVADSYKKIL